MRKIKILPAFERTFKKLSLREKAKVKKSLLQLNSLFMTNSLPKGLGLTKLSDDIYEIRVDLKIRIILKMEEEMVYFVMIGSHQDIKEYLKRIK